VLAFFELPNQPEMGRDQNTPDWVQHIAFEVDSLADLEATKARLIEQGIDVVGVTDHTLFKSIYFFDPNGHRIELAWPDPAGRAAAEKLNTVKDEMLDEWSRTRRAPTIGQFVHAGHAATAES
jgi:catechol-2,3-dioxygenase